MGARLNQHDKTVIRNFYRWLKTETRETRENRSAAARKFLDMIRAGTSIEEAKAKVCEAHDLTDRQLRNIISGRALLTHDGAVDMQAKIQRVVAHAENQIERISEHLQNVLEDIDQAERDGVERYELEYERSSGGVDFKGATSKTKSVPLDEARFIIMKRYMGELKTLTSMIKDLVPDHVINTTVFNTVNQKEVEDEIRALIGKNRLNDTVFKEQK